MPFTTNIMTGKTTLEFQSIVNAGNPTVKLLQALAHYIVISTKCQGCKKLSLGLNVEET